MTLLEQTALDGKAHVQREPSTPGPVSRSGASRPLTCHAGLAPGRPAPCPADHTRDARYVLDFGSSFPCAAAWFEDSVKRRRDMLSRSAASLSRRHILVEGSPACRDQLRLRRGQIRPI